MIQAQWRRFYRRIESRPEFAAAMILGVLIVFMAGATTSFLTGPNLLWVALSFSTVAIAAIGMLLVIGSGSIELSVGSQMGLSAEIAGWIVYTHPGTPDLVVFLAAAGSGMIFGLVNGILAARWGFNAFIATLGTGYIGRGLAVILSNDRTYSGFSPELLFLGQGSALGLPAPVWILLILAIVWSFVLRHTVYGQYIFALGGNRSAARLSGVPVIGVSVSAFVFSGGRGQRHRRHHRRGTDGHHPQLPRAAADRRLLAARRHRLHHRRRRGVGQPARRPVVRRVVAQAAAWSGPAVCGRACGGRRGRHREDR
jgi:ribose/xylose/arabinose/galactoside ABC-type transport system permease subunit